MAIRFHMFSIEHLQQKNCLVYDRLINRKSTNTKLNSYSYDLLCFNTNNEISIILQKLKWKWKKILWQIHLIWWYWRVYTLTKTVSKTTELKLKTALQIKLHVNTQCHNSTTVLSKAVKLNEVVCVIKFQVVHKFCFYNAKECIYRKVYLVTRVQCLNVNVLQIFMNCALHYNVTRRVHIGFKI